MILDNLLSLKPHLSQVYLQRKRGQATLMKISNGVLNRANIKDSCHKRILSFKVKKMHVGKYYHKKMKTCEKKSVSEMKKVECMWIS